MVLLYSSFGPLGENLENLYTQTISLLSKGDWCSQLGRTIGQFSIPGLCLPFHCDGEGQGSLTYCTLWDLKELAMTEQNIQMIKRLIGLQF